MLRLVTPKPKVEHKPICSVDKQPWPCAHHQAEAYQRRASYFSVLCLACGKPRNAWASLSIDDDGHGRAIYFHARLRCRPKAKAWWEEHVTPHTGESFDKVYGFGISHLGKYISGRGTLKAV